MNTTCLRRKRCADFYRFSISFPAISMPTLEIRGSRAPLMHQRCKKGLVKAALCNSQCVPFQKTALLLIVSGRGLQLQKDVSCAKWRSACLPLRFGYKSQKICKSTVKGKEVMGIGVLFVRALICYTWLCKTEAASKALCKTSSALLSCSKSKWGSLRIKAKLKSIEDNTTTGFDSKTVLAGEVFKESFTDIFQTSLEQVAFSLESDKNRCKESSQSPKVTAFSVQSKARFAPQKLGTQSIWYKRGRAVHLLKKTVFCKEGCQKLLPLTGGSQIFDFLGDEGGGGDREKQNRVLVRVLPSCLQKRGLLPRSKQKSKISLTVKVGDYLSSGDKIGEKTLQRKGCSGVFFSSVGGTPISLQKTTLTGLHIKTVTNRRFDSPYKDRGVACDLISRTRTGVANRARSCAGGLTHAQQDRPFQKTAFLARVRRDRPWLRLTGTGAAVPKRFARRFARVTNLLGTAVSKQRPPLRRPSFIAQERGTSLSHRSRPAFTRNSFVCGNTLSKGVQAKQATLLSENKIGLTSASAAVPRRFAVVTFWSSPKVKKRRFQMYLQQSHPCKKTNDPTVKKIKQSKQREKSFALTDRTPLTFKNEKCGLKKTGTPVVLTSSGRVLTISKTQLIIQKTQPILFYNSANLHVKKGEWVQEGSPILTLTHQTLITGDIVQGIPRIEQLFEAFTSPPVASGLKEKQTVTRFKDVHDTLHSQVRDIFRKHWLKSRLPIAVRKSLEEIQYTLVEMIQKVYLSQGVLIADKHIEIIIRQIASKGQILDSGTTGLFLEEVLPIRQIENANLTTPGKKCLYVPAVMGLTAAALNSDSFISAASFQETTRVLSRDAVVGKSDFLRGLKEKVVIGDLISAGTGLDIYFIYTTMLSP